MIKSGPEGADYIGCYILYLSSGVQISRVKPSQELLDRLGVVAPAPVVVPVVLQPPSDADAAPRTP